MTDITALTEGRDWLFRDLFSGKVPKRVPVSNPATVEFVIQYAGMNMAEAQWDLTKLEPAYDKFCRDFVGDTNPVGTLRIPSFHQILGSTAFVMSSSGYMQHPEVEGLLPEEYDEFIASPYDCIVETILPRLYTELNAEPNKKAIAIALAKAMRAYQDDFNYLGSIKKKMDAKYGYSSMGRTRAEAPFDFLADFLRGFKGIFSDLRRSPDKVLAACEAVFPLMVKTGTFPNPSMLGFVSIPLHMAPYMRKSDFEKFYWPTFKRLVDTLSDLGQPALLFVEHDWTRYLDCLYELPANTIMRFEFGDPKLIKEKLGNKHIISGFYPVTLLQTGTKQQCLDKAKELLDILAPGGKYWWNADKNMMNLDAGRRAAENLRAVLECVYANGSY